MAKLFISLKPFLIVLFSAIPTAFAEITDKIVSTDKPPIIVFYVCFIWVMSPEPIIYFNKDLQQWLKEGFENADGKLNRDDLKELSPHYLSLWAVRVWVIMILCLIFYKLELETYFYWMPITIVLGSSGTTIIKTLRGK